MSAGRITLSSFIGEFCNSIAYSAFYVHPHGERNFVGLAVIISYHGYYIPPFVYAPDTTTVTDPCHHAAILARSHRSFMTLGGTDLLVYGEVSGKCVAQ
jgi:hypothetical protein